VDVDERKYVANGRYSSVTPDSALHRHRFAPPTELIEMNNRIDTATVRSLSRVHP